MPPRCDVKPRPSELALLMAFAAGLAFIVWMVFAELSLQ